MTRVSSATAVQAAIHPKSKNINYLFSLLTRNPNYNPPTSFIDSSGRLHVGCLLSIEREDGSGRSFNLTIATQQNDKETFHLRFIEG